MFRFIIFLIIAFFINASSAKETLITDKKGQSLKVKLMGFEGGKVEVISLSNRKKYTIPLERLEEKSQRLVREWVKGGGHLSTKFEIEFQSGKTDRSENSYSYSSARKQMFEPEVTVKNDSVGNEATCPVKMVVVILAKPTEMRGSHYVLAKEDFKVPSIAQHKSHSVKLKEFEESYFDSRYSSYKSGNKYTGYAVYLLANKEVVHSKFVPSSLEKQYGEALLGAKARQYVKSD